MVKPQRSSRSQILWRAKLPQYSDYQGELILESENGQKLHQKGVVSGCFNQPIRLSENLEISLSHSKEWRAILTFGRGILAGVDLEPLNEMNFATENQDFTKKELSIAQEVGEHFAPVILWSAKESLSKALRLGFTSELALYEVSEMKKNSGYWQCRFTNFPQFVSISAMQKGQLLSLAFPSHYEMSFTPPLSDLMNEL